MYWNPLHLLILALTIASFAFSPVLADGEESRPLWKATAAHLYETQPSSHFEEARDGNSTTCSLATPLDPDSQLQNETDTSKMAGPVLLLDLKTLYPEMTLRHPSTVTTSDSVAELTVSSNILNRSPAPFMLRSTGQIDLGTFDVRVCSEAAEQTCDEANLPMDLNLYVGEFSRNFCLDAALYPTRESIGDTTQALGQLVPKGVTPACGTRLSPYLLEKSNSSIHRQDLAVPRWPLSSLEQCKLTTLDHFKFSFQPAASNLPVFCKYVEKGDGHSASALSEATQRLVHCEVFVDLRLWSWYTPSIHDILVLKLAAAIAQAAPKDTTAPIAHNTTKSTEIATKRCSNVSLGQSFFYLNTSTCDRLYTESLNNQTSSKTSGSQIANAVSDLLVLLTLSLVTFFSLYFLTHYLTKRHLVATLRELH